MNYYNTKLETAVELSGLLVIAYLKPVTLIRNRKQIRRLIKHLTA